MRTALLLAGAILSVWISGPTAAETTATITVENKTNSYVNVSIDGGGYFCHTSPHTPCPRPFPIGHHSLRAVRTDNNAEAMTEFDLTENGYNWIPFPEEQQ